MANKVCALKNRIQEQVKKNFLNPSHPLLCVEHITLPLDPGILGNVLSVVPALKMPAQPP